jgi:hypothetical protein
MCAALTHHALRQMCEEFQRVGNVPGDLCVGESPGRPEKETYLSRQVCHCELFPQTEHMSLRGWGVSDGGATSVYLPFLRTLPSHLPTASVLDSVKPGMNGQRSQNSSSSHLKALLI